MEAVRQELLQCKQKIHQLLIKDYQKHLPITKTTHLKHDVLQLPEMIERGEMDRDKEKDEIFTSMRNLRQDIIMLRTKLKSFEKSQQYLDQIQQISTTIEERFLIDYHSISASQFKEKMMNLFDTIADEEGQLTHDLDIIDSKIEAYENQPIQTKPSIMQKPNYTQIEDLKENINYNGNNKQRELEEYKFKIDRIDERIKLNGGKTCNWDNDDHNDFLRIKTKHQGKIGQPQFLVDCVKNIPLHTEDEIHEHIERYVKYCELEDLKKNLVSSYKQLKQEAKNDLINQAEFEDKQKLEIENHKKKSKEQVELERGEQKQLIQQWKTKKVTHKLVELDQREEEKNEFDKNMREKRQVEREQKKFIVDQYKEQKQLQQVREKESDQYHQMMKRNISQDAKTRIRAREDEMVDRRMSKLESERIKQMEKEYLNQRQQEDKQIKFAYIEPKLLEVTKAAKMHQRGKFDPQADTSKYADTFGGNLLGAGRRAIPLWRQGAQL